MHGIPIQIIYCVSSVRDNSLGMKILHRNERRIASKQTAQLYAEAQIAVVKPTFANGEEIAPQEETCHTEVTVVDQEAVAAGADSISSLRMQLPDLMQKAW